MLTPERIKSVRIPNAQDLTLREMYMLLVASKNSRNGRFDLACLAYKAGYLRGAGQAKQNAPASAETPTEATPQIQHNHESEKELSYYDTVF